MRCSAGLLLALLATAFAGPSAKASSRAAAVPPPPLPRIIGGTQATAGQFPFMAYVLSGTEFCGGTVISNFYVLTAAHCIKDIGSNKITSLSQVSVTVGNVDRTQGRVVSVDAAYIHPQYDNSVPAPQNVDLAVFHTTTDLLSIQGVQAITLNTNANIGACETAGTNLVVVGWGNTVSTTTGNSGTPNVLNWVAQVTGDISACKTAYANSGQGTLPSSMFCASNSPASAGGKDACTGDSGGPLLLNQGTQQNPAWVECGIVNGGSSVGPPSAAQCGTANNYGTYCSVSKFQALIASIVNGTSGITPWTTGGGGGGGAGALVVPSLLVLVFVLLTLLSL